MIYINKILPIIVSPLGLIIILLFFGVFRKRMLPSMIALILLIILSLPIVSRQLIKFLEQGYTLISPNNVDTADTVIVLSGMIRTIKQNNEIYYEFSDAVDRVFAGIELLKLNKAQKIILTRGKLPWSLGMPEGEFLAQFVKSQGINKNQVILTEVVQNTNDEAIAVSKILPKNSKIILVTSAFHMPRAKTVFENQNLKVIPYAVDFRLGEKKMDVLDFLPQANAFKDSSFYFREIIGRAYYSLRY
ncbi:MAG: YdcF family protein [Paracoccaceae bacterium]|jgi:uncharacterized SAM-binding protein YcdF (DUF218 family)|nr:YdcF family protein [Paracoccaceae bacterium]